MLKAPTRRRGRLLSLLCLFAALTATVVVSALALAAGDDRALAESLLREVDASPKKAVATELSGHARAALDRGQKLRASGDESHARLADRLARTWAEAARDFVRAATLEESAAEARRDATDAGAVSDRERALLEEAVAQSGRLRALLEASAKDGKAETPARTSTAATSDAGAKAPPKPAKDGGAAETPKPAPKAPAKDGGAK